jgi:hypothetical protein
VTSVELTDDLAEPRVGQGISEEDQPTEECKDRWAETNQSADRDQRGLTLLRRFGNEAAECERIARDRAGDRL